jgi:hypothetical protein
MLLLWGARAGMRARRRALFVREFARPFARFARLAAVAGLAVLVQSCADVPRSPFSGPDPSDPKTRTRAVDYRSTLAPYESRRPAEPASWRELNERVAPSASPPRPVQ